MKYFLLKDSLVLTTENNSFNIKNGSPNYEKIRALVELGDFKSALKILNEPIEIEGITEKDGRYFVKDKEFPTFLISYLKKNPSQSEYMQNFWLNLSNYYPFDEARQICFDLVKRNFFPLSKDGFFLGVNDGNPKSFNDSSLSQKGNQKIKFINTMNLPEELESILKEKSFEGVIQHCFGDVTPKGYRIILSKLTENVNFINTKVLFLGQALNKILNKENLTKFMEQLTSKNVPEFTPAMAAIFNNYLQELGLEKDQKTINQKKVLNFLNTVEWSKVSNFCMEVDRFKTALNLTADQIPVYNNFNDVLAYVSAENKKIFADNNFPLRIDLNFPEFFALDGLEVDDLRVVIPKDAKTLFQWSTLFNNCISSFASRVWGNSSLVFGLEHRGSKRLMYHIEIHHRRLAQIEAKGEKQLDRKNLARHASLANFLALIEQKGLIFR